MQTMGKWEKSNNKTSIKWVFPVLNIILWTYEGYIISDRKTEHFPEEKETFLKKWKKLITFMAIKNDVIISGSG